MKIPNILFAVAFGSLLLAGCNEDNVTSDEVQLSLKINNNSGRPADLSEAKLMVSLETSDGTPIHTLKEISFEQTSDGVITTALDLAPGDYVVRELAVTNREDEVLYTIPGPGSTAENMVSKPMGFHFVVPSGGATEVMADVVAVEGYKPADLGLASFNLRNSFQIEVMDEISQEPVPAKAFVLEGTDTVARFDLVGGRNRLAFGGDLSKKYILVVTNGGSTFTREITLAELMSHYFLAPLKVLLKGTFTMTTNGAATDVSLPVSFYIGGTEGQILINWGDGTLENYSLDTEYEFEVAHTYADQQDYTIVISGDIDKINYFYSFYGSSVFKSINFKSLKNLVEIRYGLTNCPAVIDLSNNSKLQFAMLPHLADMKQLKLPKSHEITFLEIDGVNRLNTAAVDEIIANVHRNSVRKNLHNGLFGLRDYWAQDEGDLTMVGPPSPVAVGQLQTLRESYGWTINPSETALKSMANSRKYGKRSGIGRAAM